MRHRRPHHPCHRLPELLGGVSLGGWRWEATEEEEGGRQGRQVWSTRAPMPSTRDVVLPPRLRALLPAPPSPFSLWTATKMFSWCLLPPVARLGAPFVLFASLTCLLRRGTRKGLRAPYLFSVCKPSAFVEFKTCNPIIHVFHSLWIVPEWNVFNEKGMLAGSFVCG